MNSFAVRFGDPVLGRTLAQTASRLQPEFAKTINWIPLLSAGQPKCETQKPFLIRLLGNMQGKPVLVT